jgi:hypothetical protein
VHVAAAVGAIRRRPAGDGEVEQALHGTRPRPAPLPSLLSFLFSLRLRLLPYRRDPERWPWWPAPVAGARGRRWPASMRGAARRTAAAGSSPFLPSFLAPPLLP